MVLDVWSLYKEIESVLSFLVPIYMQSEFTYNEYQFWYTMKYFIFNAGLWTLFYAKSIHIISILYKKALDCKRMNFKTVEKALSDIQDR